MEIKTNKKNFLTYNSDAFRDTSKKKLLTVNRNGYCKIYKGPFSHRVHCIQHFFVAAATSSVCRYVFLHIHTSPLNKFHLTLHIFSDRILSSFLTSVVIYYAINSCKYTLLIYSWQNAGRTKIKHDVLTAK